MIIVEVFRNKTENVLLILIFYPAVTIMIYYKHTEKDKNIKMKKISISPLSVSLKGSFG